MAILSEAQWPRLSDDGFAVPGKRELPIFDGEHARRAWETLDRTAGLTAAEKAKARARIVRALRRFGVAFAEQVEEAGETTLIDTREAEIADEAGHIVEVTIARPGVSANGYIYTPAVLAEAAPLWNGAPAFLDHPTALDQTRAGGRSLRDLVGVYEGASYERGRGIRARLRLAANDHGAFETIREAIAARAAGRTAAPVGISADWRLLKSPAPRGPGGRPRWNVHSIVAVNSGDLVIRPSAGGSFDRILEAAGPAELEYEPAALLAGGMVQAGPGGSERRKENGGSTMQPKNEGVWIGAREGAEYAALSGETAGVVATPASSGSAGAGAPGDSALSTQNSALGDAVEAALRPVKLQLAAATLEARLGAARLPAPAVEQLRGQFAGRVFEAGELDGAIRGMRAMLGEIFGQQSIRGAGSVLDSGVAQGITPLDKVQAAFDRLFGLPVADALANVPRLSGIREGYILITGDKFFDGRYHWENSVVREANETTTTVMANVVLNSMTKRLVADYQGQSRWWEPLATRVALADLKRQDRILLNDFGSLASVGEAAAYATVAWDDGKESYTPSKVGNIVSVTLEMFINDDLHAVRRIPSKLAQAATVTVNETVAALFTANGGVGPAMADTHDVFDAANHQGNLLTTMTTDELQSTSLEAAMTVLEKMTNSAGKRIGVIGRYLLVPADLRWTAMQLTRSQLLPGSPNNDINPLAGEIVPIVVPQFTNAHNWYLVADPRQIECIEVGFLNGREEPELLMQDSPSAGTVFTNDEISYKVRHIYGAGVLDYRGLCGAVPAQA